MEMKKLLNQLGLSEYIAFDFETTGLSPVDDKIIEIAAIKFLNGDPVDRFVKLINPERPIDPFITDITGISDKMVKGQPIESEILDDFLEFLSDLPLVAHNISFDKSFLDTLCSRYEKKKKNNQLFDTLQLSRTFLFFHPVHNLGTISEYFGLSSDGSHRAEIDTENCGMIFQKLVYEAASYPLETISKIVDITSPINLPNNYLYTNLAEELKLKGNIDTGITKSKIKKISYSNIYNNKGTKDINTINVSDVFNDKGLLSDLIEDYEYRSNQEKYSAEIHRIINGEKNIGVLEAGTGLGKTLGYLFPAIKQSKEQGKCILVSCHTKNLQDQLFYKDLPILSSALGISLNAALLKGRSNYICKTRFNWLMNERNKILSSKDIESILPLIIWLLYTETGDLSECSGFWNSRPVKIPSLIKSEKGYCTTSICAKNDGCYFGKIRRSSQNTELLIINHALLFAEIENEGILPEHNTVIIDEAHNLVDTAYNQLQKSINAISIISAIERIDPENKSASYWRKQLDYIVDRRKSLSNLIIGLHDLVERCKIKVNTLFDEIGFNIKSRFNSSSKYVEKYIIYDLKEEYGMFKNEFDLLKTDIVSIIDVLNNLNMQIKALEDADSDFSEILTQIDSFIDSLNNILKLINDLTQDQNFDWVYWQEGIFRSEENFELVIYGCPIDISKNLVEEFFKKVKYSILTSATLRVNDSFKYYFSRTGLDSFDIDNVISGVFESPFYYEDQVNYFQYVGRDGQDPGLHANIIYELHNRYNKRILALFTSKFALTNAYQELRNKPNSRNIPIFAQIKGSSRHSIIKAMHATKNGIILGTNSFWEGIDLPGELLEILIVAKLPFGVPTEPTTKAFSDLLEKQNKNPFLNYNVPESVIKFRQGFGRLIRTTKDSGVFIVMDERIAKKRYGQSFSDAIPSEMIPFSNINEIHI